MEDITRKYNPMVDMLKFTSNKKILSKVIQIVTKFCPFWFEWDQRLV